MKEQELPSAPVGLFRPAPNLPLFSAGVHAQNPSGIKRITSKIMMSTEDDPLLGHRFERAGRNNF